MTDATVQCDITSSWDPVNRLPASPPPEFWDVCFVALPELQHQPWSQDACASTSDLICSRVVTQAGLKCSIITVFFCFLAAYSMWPGLIESLMFISNFLLSASLHSLGMLIIILTLFYICQWNVHMPFKVRKGSPHSKLVFKNQPHTSLVFILPAKCNYCKRTWLE